MYEITILFGWNKLRNIYSFTRCVHKIKGASLLEMLVECYFRWIPLNFLIGEVVFRKTFKKSISSPNKNTIRYLCTKVAIVHMGTKDSSKVPPKRAQVYSIKGAKQNTSKSTLWGQILLPGSVKEQVSGHLEYIYTYKKVDFSKLNHLFPTFFWAETWVFRVKLGLRRSSPSRLELGRWA